MNSHPFGYESGYNNVAGRRNYNENRHQGWNNQRWEEPQGFDQPSWQQPPPMDYQQPPPYAYEPFPQHNFGPPHSQAPSCHSPPYDPNPQPPYQPPYEPYEPYIEPPQFQSNHSQPPPLSFVACPSLATRKAEDRLKETIIKFQATIQQLEQALIQWASRRSNIQESAIAPCG